MSVFSKRRYRLKPVAAFMALFVAFFISACERQAESQVPPQPDTNVFKIVTVAEKLQHPWSVAFLPDDGYLVTERRGRLWHIDAQGRKNEITGVPPVYHSGQGGLLDVVLSPDFATDSLIYFSYAGEAGGLANTEVARAELNMVQKRLKDVEVIFKAEPKVSGSNHWGSRLLFAPDGTLFVTLGERFNYEDEAQNPENHLGTIVRLMPDGSVPSDNPFVGNDEGIKPEIYSYGHRNVQGIALHPDGKSIWSHEHGPRGGDEINILKAGANYGWPAVTFGISYMGFQISDKTSAPGMEDPVLHWTPSIAPSGMAFYTNGAIKEWNGNLFVGALAEQHLRRIVLDGDKVVEQQELLTGLEARIRDVRQGPDGHLYVLTDSPEGRLLRLEPK